MKIGEPVGSGLVASLPRPGGNVTGLSSISPQLSGKRPQLLTECLPALSRTAVLRNPNDAGTALEYTATERAAGPHGLSLQGLEVRRDTEFLPALEAARAWRAEGLVAFSDPLVVGN